MRVRRLLAGELLGAEKERTEAHVASCARCAAVQQELAEEREALRRDVPFDAFAAGVAEKLARQPRRNWAQRWAPLAAAAAGLALVAGTALALRPSDETGVRSKGGVSAQLFVQDARGVRELGNEPVAAGARLMIKLHPGAHKRARAVLVEPGEESVIYDGPAVDGTLPQAFEWTGSGPATLRVKLDEEMVEIKLHR
jgi:hypothetical protein